MYQPIFRSLALLLSAQLALSQDRTTETGEAAIKDPNIECKAYSYGPVASNLASFPPVWQPAKILAGDTNANAKWQQIKGSVPNITTKGTPEGNFTATYSTYAANDPDCWWTAHQCTTPKHDGVPADIASIPEPRTLGYGFDDGPNCSHNAFYDYLLDKKQKATMFYVGSNVMNWPLEAQRSVTDGHEICAHTWSHRYMTALSNEDAFAELYYTMQAIRLVAGVTTTCWRPPFGDVDDRIRAIASGLGLKTILWKYDSFDWKVGSGQATDQQVQENYQKLINDVDNGKFDTEGAVILTHELNNYTMSVAVKWYDQLKDAFDHIVPMATALNITQPYVEANYTFAKFGEPVSPSPGSPQSGQETPRDTSSAASREGSQWAVTLSAALVVGLVLI